jgi:hypothetical protein
MGRWLSLDKGVKADLAILLYPGKIEHLELETLERFSPKPAPGEKSRITT